MKINDYVYFLSLNPLFKGVTTEEIRNLFENPLNVSITTYKKNSMIHFEGEKASTLDIVMEGTVFIQKIDEKGNVLTITEFAEGDNMGGNLLFLESLTYPMSIISKTHVVILHIKKDTVLRLCQSNINFLTNFLRDISIKATILTNKIKGISQKTIREKIIDFLNYEYYLQDSHKIQLRLTKKELAEKLGIQRTSLSRELNKMREEDLISFDTHSITIKDKSAIISLFD